MLSSPLPHVHTQNGLAYGHEDIGNAHQSSSLCLGARSIACSYDYSSEAHRHPILFCATASDWVRGKHLVLMHFGCPIYVPITPPQCIKMSSQWRMSIYVGFESPTLNRYTLVRRSICHFDETVFPSLGGDKNVYVQQERRDCRGLSPLCLITIPLLHTWHRSA